MNISDARTETGSALTGKGGEWMDYIKNVASVLEMVEPVDGVIKISADVRDLLVKLLRGQEQWISVKDRLPDKQPCEYLVVNANNVETAICLDNRWITPRRVIKITHWMPLPEPPEVKQDD